MPSTPDFHDAALGWGEGTSRTAAEPAEAKIGDLLILTVLLDLTGADMAVAGFTPVGARTEQTNGPEPFQVRQFWAVKKEGMEPAVVSWGGSKHFCATHMGAIKNARQEAPVTAILTASSSSTTTVRGPSRTVVDDHSLLYFAGFAIAETAEYASPPAGMYTEGFGAGFMCAAELDVAKGASGNRDALLKTAAWNIGGLLVLGPREIPPLSPTTAPRVAGTMLVGKTLEVDPGVWEGEPYGFNYQWELTCEGGGWIRLPGAESKTLKVLPAYEGRFLRCLVEAVNEDGGLEVATSARRVPSPGRQFALDRPMHVPKLSALIDGLAGADDQPVKGIIYDSGGNLVGESEEVMVKAGSEETWIDLRFSESGGLVLEEGEYELGVIAGPPACARIATISGIGARAAGEDLYGTKTTALDGAVTLPASTIDVLSTTGFDSAGEVIINGQEVFYTSKDATTLKGCTGGTGMVDDGAPVSQSGAAVIRDEPTPPVAEEGELMVFATYFVDPPTPEIEDLQIGRYPFDQAQAILGADAPVDGSARVGACTWHGTKLNPERGSFLVVQRDGHFADLVGERVRVSTFLGRSVSAYVLAEADLNEEDDISLTRRLFLELSPLALETLNVRVEILSSQGSS